MPKIRGIKPDFWTDDEIVELSAYARLLYIGLWNLACDNGHVEDRPRQIKMRLLPADDVNVDKLLDELTSSGRITRSAGWITVQNLGRHQKIDKRYFVTCSKAGCERPADAPDRPSRAKQSLHDGGTTGARRAHTVHTSGAHVDGDGDGDGDGDIPTHSARRGHGGKDDDRFDEFWEVYDHKEGRKRAEAAYRAALKKPGVTADLLLAAAADYIAWRKSENKHPEFTKLPTTWLHGEHWTDERPARELAKQPKRVTADQLEQPPDGLSPEEYSQWLAERRVG